MIGSVRQLDSVDRRYINLRPDSLLGVRGLVDAYARGNVTLANALGTVVLGLGCVALGVWMARALGAP